MTLVKTTDTITTIEIPFEVTQVFWMTVSVWDKYDLIIHQGGTSSSKTYSIMQLLLLKAAEKERTITVIGQDLPNLKVGPIKDTLQIIAKAPSLLEYLKGGSLRTGYNKSGSPTFTFANGSILEFKSYDDAQDAQSGKRDIAFFNEVYGIDRGIFDEVNDRTSEKTLADFNPSAKFWIHDLAKEDDAVRIITNYMHNKFVAPKVVKKLLKYKERAKAGNKNAKNRWRVYGLGLTGAVKGVIYPDVEFITLSKYPGVEKLDKYGYGLDYGYSNDPMAMVDAGVYKGDIYARGLIYQTGLKLHQLANLMEELEVDDMDIIAMDDSQAKEQADLLRDDYGYYVKMANRRAGSILQGIGLLQDFFIYIVDTSNGDWEKEQQNYKWLERLGQQLAKPVDKDNHFWDALRYWALEMLTEIELEDFEEVYAGF